MALLIALMGNDMQDCPANANVTFAGSYPIEAGGCCFCSTLFLCLAMGWDLSFRHSVQPPCEMGWFYV